jgi:hypothetical protein
VRRTALLLLLVAACGREPARSPAPAAPPSRAAESPAPDLPPPGEARAARLGGRYSVLATDAAPAEILAALAAAAGFEVEGAGGAPEAPRSLALREVTLESALASILGGVAYDVQFAPGTGAAGAMPTPIRVRIARDPAGAGPRPGPTPEAPRPRPPPGTEAGAEASSARDPAALESARAEAERAESVARGWTDPRDAVRLEAVAQMDPEAAPDRARLGALLRADPSPEVRIAAAEALAEGDPFAVMDALLGALEDPEPEVIAAAVRALEDVYEEAPSPRIRERIQGLAQHRDATVREAVAEFEEWSLE